MQVDILLLFVNRITSCKVAWTMCIAKNYYTNKYTWMICLEQTHLHTYFALHFDYAWCFNIVYDQTSNIFMSHACMCSPQVLLAWSQTSASADLAFTKEVFSSLLGLVSPSSMDAVLKHSRSQRSSDAQPQSLGEQLYVNLEYFACF